jgi:hypothetical protein
MDGFNALVAEFLAAEKVATKRFRWTGKRADWVRAGSPIIVEGRHDLRGRLEISAHLYRRPEKYSFALLFRNERVFALDVSPGHAHTNARTLETIFGTHWQCWPSMDAVADDREFIYGQWLDEFLKRARITIRVRSLPPPVGAGTQLKLFE